MAFRNISLAVLIGLVAVLTTSAQAQVVNNPFGLGAAQNFAVLDLSGTFQYSNPQSSITGNLGVVSGGSLNTSDGVVTGDVLSGQRRQLQYRQCQSRRLSQTGCSRKLPAQSGIQ